MLYNFIIANFTLFLLHTFALKVDGFYWALFSLIYSHEMKIFRYEMSTLDDEYL